MTNVSRVKGRSNFTRLAVCAWSDKEESLDHVNSRYHGMLTETPFGDEITGECHR